MCQFNGTVSYHYITVIHHHMLSLYYSFFIAKVGYALPRPFIEVNLKDAQLTEDGLIKDISTVELSEDVRCLLSFSVIICFGVELRFT